MRPVILLIAIGGFLLFSSAGYSQVTTNGASGLATSYSSLEDAFTALNAADISSPVVIDLHADQTAPIGGYIISVEGSAGSPIVINGNYQTITAAGNHISGNFNDAIFKLVGADWITLKKFTLQENPTVTNGSDASNTVTEWGIALLAASLTNGCQHNTIQDNIISLRVSPTDRNTFGIYSSAAHGVNSISTGGNPTTFSGTNSLNKIYANRIYEVNFGISFIGSNNEGSFDNGNELGGELAGLGNTITHFGKVTPSAIYASNTFTNFGIQAVNQVNDKICNNTLVSNAITSSSTGVRGILKSSSTGTTGSVTSNINYNTITLQYSASPGDMIGILSVGSAAANGVTLHINNNSIIKCKLTGGGSGIYFKGITNSAPVGSLYMTDNLVRGLSSNQTGGVFTAYENTGAVVNVIHINDNKVGNEEGGAVTFSTAVTGSCQVISNTNGGPASSLLITGNQFYGISHLISSSHGITFVENAAASVITRNLNQNQFRNIFLNTSSSVTFIRNASNIPVNGILTVNNNEVIGNFTKTGSAGDVKIFDSSTSFTAGAGAVANINYNHFSNLTFSGTSLFSGILYNMGSSCTISGNVFSNLNLGGTNVTGNAGITVSTGSVINIAENHLTDITTPFAFSAILCASTGTSAIIDSNQIDTINAGTSLTGISYTGSHTLVTLGENAILNLTSTNGSVTGLNCMLSNGTTATAIFKNKLSDLVSNHSSGTVSGLKTGKSAANPGIVSIYNNYTGDLRAPVSGVDNAIRGMEISSTNDPGTFQLYYNTIYLDGISTGVNFGASVLFVTSGSGSITLDIRNNILTTISTPNGSGLNVVLRGLSFTASNYIKSSNHNLLYAGMPGAARLISYASAMTFDITLAAFQSRVYPADHRSVSQLPLFLSTDGSSPDFLHINPGMATPIENGGTPNVGITEDYDGNVRVGNVGYAGTGTLPDIGADEGDFIMLDILGPNIDFTPLSHTASLSNRNTEDVSITDINGVEISGGLKPRLYFKKKTQANTFHDNTSATDGWKYVEANVVVSPFDFTIDYTLLNGGAVDIGDTMQYFIIAQDMATVPNVGLYSGILTLDPASVILDASHFPLTNLINSYVIKVGIEGIKTVCASGCDYGSLTNTGGIFEAINAALVTDDLTIQIAGNLAGELGTHPLNSFPDTLAITILPTGGVTRIISGAAPSGFALIDFNGADQVTIDGINAAGDSLTIINTTVSAITGTSTIRFRNGASGNSILRCKVLGSSTVVLGSGGGNIYFNNSTSANNSNIVEHCDLGPAASGLPNVLVYASNAYASTGNTINQCRLYDFFSATKSSSAIYLENAVSSTWTISGNKMYQRASRTFSAGTILHTGISINGGVGHTLMDNTIGYASSAGTGTYTLVGVNGSVLIPINLSVGNTDSTEVQGNRISKISFTGPMSGTGASSPFIGINVTGGLVNVGTITGNSIGDSLSISNIVFGISSSTSISDIHGVFITGATSDVAVEHNSIAGIDATIGANPGGTRIYGLRSVSDAKLKCRFNKVGSAVLNSIRSQSVNNSSVYGIVHNSNTTATIAGNIIRNLFSAATTGATSVTGIEITSTALQYVLKNRIFRLTSTASTGTGISSNAGIRISSSLSEGMMSNVEGNLIHSIVSSQSLDHITGIHLVSGNNTCTNNMIRLGRRVDINSITAPCQIIGVHDEVAIGITKLFYNSIYIGGANVTTGVNTTAAFRRSNTTTCEVRNNILANARQNGSGTGKHYVFSFAGGGVSNNLDHNLYFNSGGNGNLFSVYAGTESSTFQAWKILAQSLNLVVDQHSDAEDPFFILPDGDANTGDLHIQVDKNSDVESKGNPSVSVLTDIDGEPRNSPPDVGADEGSFSSPVILYLPLPSTTSLSNRLLTNVSITPPGGVNVTPGTKPRVYFKKKQDANDNGGWKYSETTSGSSPFSFIIDYTQLNDGMAGENDTIQYFVIAQDTAVFPRVAIEDGYLNGFPFSVDLSESEFPITGSINEYVIRKTITGTKTICLSGCDYTSLTNDGGFFQQMNGGVVIGDVVAEIQGDLLEETGTHPLNAFAPGFAVTIKPSGGLTRIISGAAIGGKPLIDFNGADSVLVDGRNTGGDSLYIINSTVSNTEGTSTILFRKDSRSCTIRNCTVSGSSSAPGSGTIYISSEAVVTGNDNIKLIRNIIGAAGSNTPANGIYLTGPAQENNNIVIDSNYIRDYFLANGNCSGIFVSSNCPGILISNNRFFQSVPRVKTNTLSARDCAVSSSSSCAVINNLIGGSDISNSGMYVFTGASLSQLHPIYLAAPTTSSSTISGNIIKHISINGAMDGSSSSRPLVGIYHASGMVLINGNTIGEMATSGSITFTSISSVASTIIGIRSDALGNDLTTEGNQIGGIAITEGGSGAIHFTGISAEMTSTRKWICSNNIIGGSVSASIQTNGAGSNRLLYGLYSTGAQAFIEGNTIQNLSLNGAASGALYGIYIQSAGGHEIIENEIYGLSSSNAVINGLYLNFTTNTASVIDRNKVHSFVPGTQSAALSGIFINLGLVKVSNNMIRLGLDIDGQSVEVSSTITGITDANASNIGDYYFNSIYIGGSVTGTANHHSIGFQSLSNSKDFRNNIVYNARSNVSTGGKHYAYTILNTNGLLSDHNLYYVTGTNGILASIAGADKADVDAIRNATTKDENSQVADPMFFDPTGPASLFDLHIDNAFVSPAEGNGVFVPYMETDYDNQLRSAYTPTDIGADAGSFTAVDNIAPVIIYTNFTSDHVKTTRQVSNILISDNASGIEAMTGLKPRLYFKKSTDENIATGWKYVEANGVSSPYDFTIDYTLLNTGSIEVEDVIEYFIVAADTADEANIGKSKAIFNVTPLSVELSEAQFPISGELNSFTILDSITGPKTVCSSGCDFTSLTNDDSGGAFKVINERALAGNVILLITSDLTAESGLVSLAEFAAPYTVTIVPDGAPRVVTYSGSGSMIILNGADRVIIDGSLAEEENTLCPLSQASRDLTFRNFNASVSIISLKSMPGNPATNNVIRNCVIEGNAASTTNFGIASTAQSVSSTSLGKDNDNNAFVNNHISKVQYGIYSQGESRSNKNEGTTITLNEIDLIAEHHTGIAGIYLGYENDVQVSGNTVYNVSSSSSSVAGIALGILPSFNLVDFIGHDVTAAIVSHNVIHDIVRQGDGSAFGITLASLLNAGPSANEISNNLIYKINSTSATSMDYVAGMMIGGGPLGATKVYHNTVRLAGVSAYSAPAFCLAIGSINPTIDLKNNILVNEMGSALGKNYALSFAYNESFGNLNSNHNNLFTTNTPLVVTGGLNNSPSGDLDDLQAYQELTEKDLNSSNVLPEFVSAMDLHLTEAEINLINLDGQGTPVAIENDIDCDARSGVAPDMGADEFGGCNYPVIISVIADVNPIPCNGNSTNLVVSGSLNSASEWNWYTGSCGDTLIGTGTTIEVTPGVNTTYFVRGEGGCANDGPCQTIAVTIEGPAVTNMNDSGSGSLREAIICAADGDTLVFDPGVLNEGDTIMVNSGSLLINKDIVINLLPSGVVKIKTTGTEPVFEVSSGDTLRMKNAMLFINGSSPNTFGRAVLNAGAIFLESVEIFENQQNFPGSGSTIHNLPGSYMEILTSCQLKMQ